MDSQCILIMDKHSESSKPLGNTVDVSLPCCHCRGSCVCTWFCSMMHPQCKVMKLHKPWWSYTIKSHLGPHMGLINACIYINNTASTSFVNLDETAVCDFSVRRLPPVIDDGQSFQIRSQMPIIHTKTCQSSYSALSNSLRFKSYGLLKLEHRNTVEIWASPFEIAMVYMRMDTFYVSMCTNMDGRLLWWPSGVLLVSL